MRHRSWKAAVLAGALGAALGAGSVLAAKGGYPSFPHLMKARGQLKAARESLEQATHNCGGHRIAAIMKVNEAMTELTRAIAYADAHPREDKGK